MKNELEFIVYSTPDEEIRVNAAVQRETIWLTQKGMIELFDCTPDNVSLHLQKIYALEELDETATAEKISVVRQEGTRQVKQITKNQEMKS